MYRGLLFISILGTTLIYGECLRAIGGNPVWRIQTLEECEKENKSFCFIGMYSEEEERTQINRFISTNAQVLKHYQTYRTTPGDLASFHSQISNQNVTDLNLIHHRPKRSLTLKNDTLIDEDNDETNSSSLSSIGSVEPHVDCSSVCCVTEDMTPPFSHIKANDGWEQVASTPEFPQRVSFYTETCTKTQAPCVGVHAADDSNSARCVQFFRHHAIAVFNRTTGLTFRYVEVPVTCKCVLAPKDQEVTPVGPSLAILKILQASESNRTSNDD